MGPSKSIRQRLQRLQQHLEQENDVLVQVVKSFRELDAVAYRMGVLATDQSYATGIPWWPLVAVLGTFSAGKSTFINDYLGRKVQVSGNQAVDDKFTVLCYSAGERGQTLPGLALDADPRFPFYKISHEIERVAAGEGRRIDAYLQLKTAAGDRLRGKILIDSPGFDADAQRTSTLRITKHIIDLSDLVLVFFDARHPEPGAMQDTLRHLVEETVGRDDSNKFLYILNQLDATAREDNPEEVVAAWQRALAQKGLTAGRFYGIYNEAASAPIEDEAVRRRYQTKRDHDLAEIHDRMARVEVERAYRIVGALQQSAQDIEDRLVPAIRERMARWRSRTLLLDALGATALAGVTIAVLQVAGVTVVDWLATDPMVSGGGLAAWVLLFFLMHMGFRKNAAAYVATRISKDLPEGPERSAVLGGFKRNVRPLCSIFAKNPAGWGRRARRALGRVTQEANAYVQALNDRFTDPSGIGVAENSPEEAGAVIDENSVGETGGGADSIKQTTT